MCGLVSLMGNKIERRYERVGKLLRRASGRLRAAAGLVFVGVSINLDKILKYAGLPGRPLEALIALIPVLITSSLMLVPGQPNKLSLAPNC